MQRNCATSDSHRRLRLRFFYLAVGESARSGQSSLLEGAWSRRSWRTSPLAVSWRGVRGANWQLPSCRRLIRHHRNRSSVQRSKSRAITSRSRISSAPIYERIKLTRFMPLGNLSTGAYCIVKQRTRYFKWQSCNCISMDCCVNKLARSLGDCRLSCNIWTIALTNIYSSRDPWFNLSRRNWWI